MNKHTPGPWEVEDDSVVNRYFEGDEWDICQVHGEGPMADANKSLIAAAPDMLACLQNWEFELVFRYGATHPGVLELRTAIAEATKSPD